MATFVIIQNGRKVTLEAGATGADTTRTVKSSGGDSTTIQGAIDLFADILLYKDNIIDVDPGTYSENLDLSSIFGRLLIRGDTRNLAGLTYFDDRPIRSEIANAGVGTCQLDNTGNVITVTGSSSNPDFQTDGWTTSDRVYIFPSDGVGVGLRNITAVSGNTITIDGTTLSNNVMNGTRAFITLIPDRELNPTGQIAKVDRHGNEITFQGFYTDPQTPLSDNDGGLECADGKLFIKNCVISAPPTGSGRAVTCRKNGYVEFTPENTGLEPRQVISCVRGGKVFADKISMCRASDRAVNANDGGHVVCNFVNGSNCRMMFSAHEGSTIIAEDCEFYWFSFTAVEALHNSFINVRNNVMTRIASGDDGIVAQYNSTVDARSCIIDDDGAAVVCGIQALDMSFIRADSIDIQGVQLGAFSSRKGFISCPSHNITGNGTNFDPAGDLVIGNADSYIDR